MRRLLFIIALVMLPSFGMAQQHPPSDTPNDISQGSEKDAHERVHPTENHGEGQAPPKTYFGIPGWILKLANMILFIGVLAYLAAGPAKKTFAARSEQIRRDLEEARARRTKADQLAADIQARLTQIESEVSAIHERALTEGERQKRDLIAAAEAEAAKILANARNEVDNRLKHARHELTEYAGQLAAKRAEDILREKITPADQQKLFSDSVRDVAEVNA